MGSHEKAKKSSHGSKHKHKKSKHHHQHRHKKKKSRSHHKKHKRIELDLEDKDLQNALDCIEGGAVTTIKDGLEISDTMGKMVTGFHFKSLGQLGSSSEIDDDDDDDDEIGSDGSLNQELKPPIKTEDDLDATCTNPEKVKEVSEFGPDEVSKSKWKNTFSSGNKTASALVSGFTGNVGVVTYECENDAIGIPSQAGGLFSKHAKSKDQQLDSSAAASANRSKRSRTEDFNESKVDLPSDGKGSSNVVGSRCVPPLLNEARVDLSYKNTDYIPLSAMKDCGVNCSVSSEQDVPAVKADTNSSSTDGTTKNDYNNCTLEKKREVTDNSATEAVKKDQLSRLLEQRLKEVEAEANSNPETRNSPKKEKFSLKMEEDQDASIIRTKSERRARSRSSSRTSQKGKKLDDASTSRCSGHKGSGSRDSGRSWSGGRRSQSRDCRNLSRDRRRRSRSRNRRSQSRDRRSRSRDRRRQSRHCRSWSRDRRCRSRDCSSLSRDHRSRSRDRRSRSRDHRRSLSGNERGCRKRSRSHSRVSGSHRNNSRRRSRSKSRTRSRSQSQHRHRRRSRSCSRTRHSRNVVYSRYRNTRRHSRSRSRHIKSTRRRHHSGNRRSSSSSSNFSCHSVRYSRGRSRSRRHHYSSRSRSSSMERFSGRSPKEKPKKSRAEVEQSVVSIAKEFSNFMQSNQKNFTISKLTNLCRKIQSDDVTTEQSLHKSSEEFAGAPNSIRAPFAIKPSACQPGLIFHNKVWKTTNQVVMEANSTPDVRPLTDKFPVSAGLQHKASDEGQSGGGTSSASNPGGAGGAGNSGSVFEEHKKVDINEIAKKRLQATEKLKQNPADIESHVLLQHVEQQTKIWAQSKVVPGKFTGQQTLTAMTKADHKAGTQAWAKENMLRQLAPVMGGFGMKMMKKMGWDEGKPLGKAGVGHLEPLEMDVKVNRLGLSTAEDKKTSSTSTLFLPLQARPVAPAALKAMESKAAHLVEGKHPVSVLQEICSKKHWDPPNYELVQSSGPSHLMTFLYKVTLPMGTFKASICSKTKKQAKMEAAKAALQGLGLLPKP